MDRPVWFERKRQRNWKRPAAFRRRPWKCPEDGRPAFQWKVSTAREGLSTPTGIWRPTRLEAMWHFRRHDNAPMPHAVFFHEGYAVQAADALERPSRPASQGCVRLHPSCAADVFQLVETLGPADTRTAIVE